MTQIKELKTVLRKGGFDYRLVYSNDLGYIYVQSDNGKTVAFEVFKRKINTYFNCVSFPGNEAFGQWAWTYRTLDEAIAKLKTFKDATTIH